jgi:membrane-associated protease RseP (regulator of RpoE activity)
MHRSLPKRFISAVVAAVVAAVGVLAAFAVRSGPPMPDLRAIVLAVAIASVIGWYLAPRRGRPGFIYRLLMDGLISAIAFALPAAMVVFLDILVSGDAGLPKDPIGILTGFVVGTGWVWIVVLTFAFPFALMWALLLRLVPDDPPIVSSG